MWQSDHHSAVETVSYMDTFPQTTDTLVAKMREAFFEEIEGGGIEIELQHENENVPNFVDWCEEPLVAVDIPCYSRSLEEAHMRPPESTESACCNGELCEGLLMAKYGHNNASQDAGFTLVAMPQSNHCILCMRVQTSMCYYRSVLTQDSDPPQQTHYNVIGEVGEYDAAACILPSQMSASTLLPVVMHQRNMYRYGSNRVVQDKQVYFRYAPAPGSCTVSGASQTFSTAGTTSRWC